MKVHYFGLKIKAPFYRFFSNPVFDPDLNPDPKRLFWFRIGSGSGQKFRIRNTAEVVLLAEEW